MRAARDDHAAVGILGDDRNRRIGIGLVIGNGCKHRIFGKVQFHAAFKNKAAADMASGCERHAPATCGRYGVYCLLDGGSGVAAIGCGYDFAVHAHDACGLFRKTSIKSSIVSACP